MANNKKRWSARFSEPTSDLMKRFNASLYFDQRLIEHELRASAAHANMLGACKIIAKKDVAAINKGLKQIHADYKKGKFSWKLEEEDIHTVVENRLTKLIGEAGKKLHTARSRNDQVSTVTRLWLRDQIDEQLALVLKARLALLEQADKHIQTIMPGFTHLQVGQPTTLASHLHAYSCMLERDYQRLVECRSRVNILPLGAAALAGTSFAIKPALVAKELGFEALCPNSMDAVSDRDFAIEYANCVAMVMVHLSRLGEEIVLWASQPFSFVKVSDAFSTGSSIMPQKRNPDAAELIRGKSARAIGNLTTLLTMIKGQPLAYNKDNQEDKEALFDSVDTVTICLDVTAKMVKGLKFDKKVLENTAQKGFATATELADELVKQGVSFRDAHAKVAQAVRTAEDLKVALSDLPLKDLAKITGINPKKAMKVLDINQAIKSRKSPGAPSFVSLQKVITSDINQVKALLILIS